MDLAAPLRWVRLQHFWRGIPVRGFPLISRKDYARMGYPVRGGWAKKQKRVLRSAYSTFDKSKAGPQTCFARVARCLGIRLVRWGLEYLGFGSRELDHREFPCPEANWKYIRRLGFCFVSVRLFVLFTYGSFDNPGWPEEMDGVRCGGSEQRDCVRDRVAHGAVRVYSCEPVLYRSVCLQYSVVGESGE